MKRFSIYTTMCMMVLLISCQSEIPLISGGLNDSYAIERMRTLILHPEYSGERYIWSMPAANGQDSIVSTQRDYIFISATPGTYRLKLEIEDASNPFTHEMLITVWEEEVAYSRYITLVHDYCPAPGQYVNDLPRYTDGDDAEAMRRKVESCISGKNDVLISLGGFGGYVTFGFDHSIVNHPDSLDFKIWGNAFYASANPNPSNINSGGSAEPGIVMVAIDNNKNGLPDDTWYELAGSEHYKPETSHNYTIKYMRTPANHTPTPKPGSGVTDTTYIRWEDNEGAIGYITRNAFHSQEYFPQWITDSTLVFNGTRLPNNAIDVNGDGSYYILNTFDWGYADNHPNNSEAAQNCFDIDWAIDRDGNKIYLPCIDFIRVYTGVNQQCGRIGETSTELCRAEDLHIEEE